MTPPRPAAPEARARQTRPPAPDHPFQADLGPLIELVPLLAGRRVLVVGDMLADHYIVGRTSRISREAPVLILKYQEERTVPGQAANTAANIAALRGRPTVLGLIGRDTAGRALKTALRKAGVDIRGLMEPKGYATLVKTRILAGGHHTARQQVIRIDDDDRSRPPDGATTAVAAALTRAADADDGPCVLVVSDYGYGLVGPEVWEAATAAARRRGIPLILDSRHQMNLLRGATLVTPNEEEAVIASGPGAALSSGPGSGAARDIDAVGRALLRATGAANVLITRGNEGMALFRPRRAAVRFPIHGTDECTDVTGAGDTVVAAVSLAMAAGADPERAARLANMAGAVVVGKLGTATASAIELLAAMGAGPAD